MKHFTTQKMPVMLVRKLLMYVYINLTNIFKTTFEYEHFITLCFILKLQIFLKNLLQTLAFHEKIYV
jgi:hypothetical protein